MVGRGSNIITAKMPNGLNVRLVSSWEKRVKHIQEYYGMKLKEAEEYISKEDRNRRNYIKKYFNKDIDDPLQYDMVINVDRLGPQETIRVIGDLVLHRYP